MNRLGIKLMITLGALLVIGAHLIWPNFKVDTLIGAMLLVAVLPWLASVIKSAENQEDGRSSFKRSRLLGKKLPALPRRPSQHQLPKWWEIPQWWEMPP